MYNSRYRNTFFKLVLSRNIWSQNVDKSQLEIQHYQHHSLTPLRASRFYCLFLYPSMQLLKQQTTWFCQMNHIFMLFQSLCASNTTLLYTWTNKSVPLQHHFLLSFRWHYDGRLSWVILAVILLPTHTCVWVSTVNIMNLNLAAHWALISFNSYRPFLLYNWLQLWTVCFMYLFPLVNCSSSCCN